MLSFEQKMSWLEALVRREGKKRKRRKGRMDMHRNLFWQKGMNPGFGTKNLGFWTRF